MERQMLRGQKILEKHFPERHQQQIEAAKYLIENPLPMPTG
ncbi:MAG: hypothetical protein OXH00_02865 [Candidatus Poribacteria bacterium]|nr:hypothetical protein [Candidatus Poribacteria bacterium]